MIKHVVLFKLKPEHKHQAAEMQRRLLTLPSQIDIIRGFEVGVDVLHSARSYDVALISEFDSLEAVQLYANHPAHVEVALFTREVSEHIVAVDYEF